MFILNGIMMELLMLQQLYRQTFRKKGNKPAIIWVGDDPSDSKNLTKNCIKMFVKLQTV